MNEIVGPDDVRASAAACHEALAGLVDRNWSILASGLDWSCRQTLEHIPSAQLFYASQLAVQAQDRLPRLRGGEDQLTAGETLLSVQVNAAILEHVLRAAPASARAFHPSGMADPSGFAGMSCDEILIHTLDITAGFGVDFQPPEEICARVLARLFPWAPKDIGAWDALRWANGRLEIPGVAPQDANWRWQCAPLSEWDGTIPRRE